MFAGSPFEAEAQKPSLSFRVWRGICCSLLRSLKQNWLGTSGRSADYVFIRSQQMQLKFSSSGLPETSTPLNKDPLPSSSLVLPRSQPLSSHSVSAGGTITFLVFISSSRLELAELEQRVKHLCLRHCDLAKSPSQKLNYSCLHQPVSTFTKKRPPFT